MDKSIGDLLRRAAVASGGEIYYEERHELSPSAFKGAISEFVDTRGRAACVRVARDGKLGTATTERVDSSALADAAAEASLNAESLDRDEGNALYEGGESSLVGLDGTWENDSVSLADKKSLAMELEERCYALDPRVANVPGASYTEGEVLRAIANAGGLYKAERSQYCMAMAYIMAGKGEDSSIGYYYQAAQRFSELSPETVAREAVEAAVSQIGASEPASGAYRVVLTNDVASALIGAFLGTTSAEAIQKGRSVLSGKRGKRVGSGFFTIVDDPYAPGLRGREKPRRQDRPGEPGDEAFDDEGVPSPRIELFSEGVFAEPLYTIYSAKREGTASNGRGCRGDAASPVYAAPVNAFIPAGRGGREELMARAGSGILITDVQGLHASLSTVSGDFSAGAKGFRIESGRRGEALKNFTVAGNFLDLALAVAGVGSDLRLDSFDGFRSPSLLVESLSISSL